MSKNDKENNFILEAIQSVHISKLKAPSQIDFTVNP